MNQNKRSRRTIRPGAVPDYNNAEGDRKLLFGVVEAASRCPIPVQRSPSLSITSLGRNVQRFLCLPVEQVLWEVSHLPQGVQTGG